MTTDPARILRERLAADADFRALFCRRPGRAAASVGIPYDVFEALWPELAAQFGLAPIDPD